MQKEITYLLSEIRYLLLSLGEEAGLERKDGKSSIARFRSVGPNRKERAKERFLRDFPL